MKVYGQERVRKANMPVDQQGHVNMVGFACDMWQRWLKIR